MLPVPVLPESGDGGAARVRQLIQTLSQEFEALQQHHEAIAVKTCVVSTEVDIDQEGGLQAFGFPPRASTGKSTEVDFDQQCSNDASIDWPVLTLDADTGACEMKVQKEREPMTALMALMQRDNGTALRNAGDQEEASPDIGQQPRQQRDTTCTSLNTQDRNLRILDTTPPISPTKSRGTETPRSARSKGESNATGDSRRSSSKIVAMDSLKNMNRKFRTSASSISLGSHSGSRIRRLFLSIYLSPWFETSFALVICLNAVVMCVEFQYSGDKLGRELEFKGWQKPGPGWTRPEFDHAIEQTFSVLEWIFGITFFLELVFKSAVLSFRVVKDIWNWIDIVTVAFFIFEKIFGSIFPVGSQWIRICRLARLSRLIKLVRTVEGFDHLYLMTTAIKGSVKILTWALALLGLIQLTIGLVLGQVLQVTYFEDDTKTAASQHEIYKYFGTFSRSILSMFEITLANWPPICRLLSEEVSEWFMVLCVIHKLTIGFAVVGVINGVFMQETFKVASSDDVIMVRQKTKAMNKHRKNMQELFNGLDNSGDGKVNLEEFRALANFPMVKSWLASMDIRVDDLDTMFKLMDSDGSGGITFEEMLHGMEKLKGQARSIDLYALMNSQQHHISQLATDVKDRQVKTPQSHQVLEMPSFPKEMVVEQ